MTKIPASALRRLRERAFPHPHDRMMDARRAGAQRCVAGGVPGWGWVGACWGNWGRKVGTAGTQS